MADFARSLNLDMQQSVAYADSASDLPMLEAAGHPVAVNPETKLAAIARKRGWHVEHWPRAAGGPRPLLPIGPRP
jgi:phosphoserine phosphatase